jgi:hypothetical protein
MIKRNEYGLLERLDCSFEVMVISDVGELTKGLICLVNAVKLDLSLIDVFIIREKHATSLTSGYYSEND